MEKKLIQDGPSPLEEEFQHEFTELIDQYKKDFLTHGWSAEELAKWCKEMVDKELRESEDERIRKALVWHLKADVDFVSNGVTKAECIAYLEKQKEQKSAWSEDIIRKAVKEIGLTQHQIDWFKTNVFPPKQEWSEEDEEMRNNIICILQTYVTRTLPTRPNSCTCSDNAFYTHQTEIDWLKSLRPSWKPSEEQLNALNFAITYFMHETNYKNPTELRDLYDELLKLK